MAKKKKLKDSIIPEAVRESIENMGVIEDEDMDQEEEQDDDEEAEEKDDEDDDDSNLDKDSEKLEVKLEMIDRKLQRIGNKNGSDNKAEKLITQRRKIQRSLKKLRLTRELESVNRGEDNTMPGGGFIF
tara:strand:+ start:100 stop:486 length:387 start_codon:yes stop_codon:yes gene_type:complete